MFELAIVLCSTAWPVHCAVVITPKPIMDCMVKLEEIRKKVDADDNVKLVYSVCKTTAQGT